MCSAHAKSLCNEITYITRQTKHENQLITCVIFGELELQRCVWYDVTAEVHVYCFTSYLLFQKETKIKVLEGTKKTKTKTLEGNQK